LRELLDHRVSIRSLRELLDHRVSIRSLRELLDHRLEPPATGFAGRIRHNAWRKRLCRWQKRQST